MTEHEQRMCELQGEVFEISESVFRCGSSYFISKYMKSAIAKKLDAINDQYNYFGTTSVIYALTMQYQSLNKREGEHYPSQVLKWIGYIYRAYCIITKQYSYKVYKDLKSEQLLSLYDSFHTFSPEYCVSQLEKIIKEKKEAKSDYEIFKSLMDMKGAI